MSAILTVAALAVAVASIPARSEDDAKDTAKPAYACTAPAELTALDHPLTRTARKLAAGDTIVIVAVGSSSTAGYGASSPAMTYPSRLQAELTERFPRIKFTVVNRGVGGEVTRDMLARFDSQVLSEKPDLVIWQVGTNSVLMDQPVESNIDLLRDGLSRLKAAGVDIILMNPQYAPKVIAKSEVDQMVDMIDTTARKNSVDLFQRFAVMRYWRLTEDVPFSTFVSSDELHMNDWSYGCVAKLLAGSIADAATRSTLTAKATPAAAAKR